MFLGAYSTVLYLYTSSRNEGSRKEYMLDLYKNIQNMIIILWVFAKLWVLILVMIIILCCVWALLLVFFKTMPLKLLSPLCKY